MIQSLNITLQDQLLHSHIHLHPFILNMLQFTLFVTIVFFIHYAELQNIYLTLLTNKHSE